MKLNTSFLKRDRYYEEFNTDPRFLAESAAPFDCEPEKSPLWLGPRKYCDEILGLYNEAETTVDGGKKMRPVRTISEEQLVFHQRSYFDKIDLSIIN